MMGVGTDVGELSIVVYVSRRKGRVEEVDSGGGDAVARG